MSERIRAIVAGFPGPYAPRIVESVLRRLPVESCIAACKAPEYVPDLPGADVSWHSDFRFADDGGFPVDWNTIRPLDEALIEEMRECEATVLAMLARYEVRGDTLTYTERKREYLRHLRYWNHVLDERRINLYILTDIPHLALTYVLYALCKKKGIPAMYFNLCPIPDTFFVIEDWEKSVIELGKAYGELLEKYKETSPEAIPLVPKFEDYYRSQTSVAAAEPVLWYMKWKIPTVFGRRRQEVWLALRRRPGQLARQAASFVVRHMTPRLGRRRRMLREARRSFAFYDRHAAPPDMAKKFVYFPLHVQPECTTTPLAGAYTDQLLSVQMLSALLPDDVYIYVKEHPRQPEYFPYGTCRPISFYEDLLKVPRVRFIPPATSTFRLMQRCVAVATATGSAGFEAPFRGKPVFMFGHNYYQFVRGVYQIHTAEDCRKAVEEIFVQGKTPVPSDMRVFLKAMEQVAIEGYYDQEYHEVSRFEDTENLERVSSALLAHLQRRLS